MLHDHAPTTTAKHTDDGVTVSFNDTITIANGAGAFVRVRIAVNVHIKESGSPFRRRDL